MKNSNPPPVANYLGFNLKEHGLKTLNDTEAKNKSTLSSVKSREDTSNTIIPDLSRSTETIILISPEKCKPWRFADRLDQEMGNIDALGTSISKHGQQEPVLLRRSPENNESFEFEVIFGRRRWAACLKLGIKLKACVKHLSDQEASIAQKEENENREGISDYSRAIYYKKLLDQKVFKSIFSLSEKMGIGKTTLTDLLSYTRVHKDILKSMSYPHKLSKAAATKLATLSSNATAQDIEILSQLANKIQEGKIPYRKIEEQLIKQKQGTTKTNTFFLPNKTHKNHDGKSLFSTKTLSKGDLLITINKETLKIFKKDEIGNIIRKLIDERTKKMESD